MQRGQVFPEKTLPDFREILSRGRERARDWRVGHSEFLTAHAVQCEAEYKVRATGAGRVMQHAQVGYRDHEKSCRAFAEVYEACRRRGVNVDRYGICLDWSMGFPRDMRNDRMRGTGLILDDAEQFAALSNSAPVASHYGDFVLGFPAALENTCCALAAGATSIGNLGQYFTFRLPDWGDDIRCTESTLEALALMAAQPVTVLAHSNLDDGFAAVFEDLACALGAVLVEQYIVEDLVGGAVSHCYGHHYSGPLARYAFVRALKQVSRRPGTMVYGNTVAYQGADAENYAAMSGYLRVDIHAQKQHPSGHAVNPVPVTENTRIPDVDEIVDAQLFAGRLIQQAHEQADELAAPVDEARAQALAGELVAGAETFRDNLLSGFANMGIDVDNPFEMLLAIRRIGGRALEQWYGPGAPDRDSGRREPLVISDTVKSIRAAVAANLEKLREMGSEQLAGRGLRVVVAGTDVHEHGKMLAEGVFRGMDVAVVDGGVSADPGALAGLAEQSRAHAVALSTYNGVALTWHGRLKDELAERGLSIPVFIGGRLNEIPEESPNSLPRDVSAELERQGAVVCRDFADALPHLVALAEHSAESVEPGR